MPDSTYSGNPATSEKDAVRFLVGDTDMARARLTDAEITWLLVEAAGNAYQAAAAAAETIAGQYAREATVSKSVGDLRLSTSYADKATEFAALAAALRRRDPARSAPLPTSGSHTAPAQFRLGIFDHPGTT
ncbi:MAG: hypothetical protein ACOYY2_13100 [Actinomycetota bacterium]